MSARLRRWYEERGIPLPWFAKRDGETPDVAALLEGVAVREILHRLIEDDPLELGKLALLVASDEARLVYPERLTARIAAQVAYRVAAGQPPRADRGDLIRWLRTHAVQCLEDLLEEDVEDERRRVPLETELEAEYATLIPSSTGIDPELARLATIIFNRFPLADRVPFYRLAIELFPLEDVAHDLNEPLPKLRRRIERVTRGLVMQVESVRDRRNNP